MNKYFRLFIRKAIFPWKAYKWNIINIIIVIDNKYSLGIYCDNAKDDSQEENQLFTCKDVTLRKQAILKIMDQGLMGPESGN